jgi:hypothetical protein
VKAASLVTAGALALATAVLTVAPVAPAFAAELPDGDALYTITDTEDAPAQLFQVDPDDAAATAIGNGADSLPREEDLEYYASQGGAFDAASGDAYFIEYGYYGEAGGQEFWLGRTDLSTGETEHVGRFHFDGDGDPFPAVTAIAIQADGDAFAIVSWNAAGCECTNFDSYLLTLDLDEATLGPIIEGDEPVPSVQDHIEAFAADPISGTLVGVGRHSGVVYIVDPGTGAFVVQDAVDWSEAVEYWTSVQALAFDSTGAQWLVVADESDEGEYVLVTNGGGGPLDVDTIHADDEGLATTSLIIEWAGGDDPENPAKPTTSNGTLFAISWDEQYNAFQLFSVDPTTGISTPVGTGNGDTDGEHSAGYQPAYDATTRTVYYIADRDTSDSEDRLVLARINTVTGVSTMGPEFWLDSETVAISTITAMAIGPDGAAYVIGNVFDGDGNRDVLFSLDLATAELSIVDDLELDEDSGGYLPILAFAADPTSGTYYAISRDESELFEIDVETGYADYIGEVGIDSFQSGSYVLAVQIDAAGRFWMLSDSLLDPDGQEGPIEHRYWVYLSSFTLDDRDSVEAGLLWDDPYYTAALLFLPTLATGPQLAATGVESDGAGAAGAIALLLLFGGTAVLVSRRRRAATR